MPKRKPTSTPKRKASKHPKQHIQSESDNQDVEVIYQREPQQSDEVDTGTTVVRTVVIMTEQLRLKDKVTIITGGSKGIGKGCVQLFVEHGSKVVFCSNEDEDGQATEKEVNLKGPGEATFVHCDVRMEDEIKTVVNKTIEKYGKLDCLINNVGIHLGPYTIDEVSADDFRKILDINLVSFFLFSKYALPYLRNSEGNIINLSSLVGQIGQEKGVTYVATKGAIASMTKALAIDEAKYNVRVNSVAPSNVLTPLIEDYFESCPDPAASRKKFEDYQLFGRFCTVEEVARACLFLATEATFCTGLDLNVTGGSEINYGNKNRRL